MQAILYFLKDTADLWYQSLINKPQDFDAFKVKFLRYFSNNNSINCLVNMFTTMKQGETKTVTTYLKCFHQNLHQIQAINTNYFTAPQILNQFIRGLCSSILQHVWLLHSGTLQDAVTRAKDFESAESEANHAQAINLTPPQNLPASGIQRPRITQQNWRSLIVVHQLIPSPFSQTGSRQQNSGTGNSQNPNFQNYLSLLVTPEDTSLSNQKPTQKQQTHTSNILPATVTNNKSLNTIFLFELEELSNTPLFSEAALEEKPITAMYADVKIDGHHIKLILDSGSAGSIITRQFIDRAASTRIITADRVTKTPISKINSIMTFIKVLVMKATQYQALIGNDWLFKVNATLDWNTQELQLTYQGQHIHVPAMCGHFKTPPREKLLIKLEEKKKKPTWEAYQVSWADANHNELLLILSWNDNPKRKQKEELTWETDDLTWTDNKQKEPLSWDQQQSLTYRRPKLICVDCGKKLSSIGACCGDDKEYQMATKFYCHTCRVKCFGRPKRMAITKIEGASPEEIRTIKNNPSEPIELDWDEEPVINFLEPEEFYEHYQNLAPTREEQKQWLAQLNTKLCCHCLIPSDFEYCDDCDLIYNPLPCMIYTIPEEEEPISSCASESELLINRNPDSDDNDENTSSSSIQNGKDNKDDSNSDSNSNSNYKQYIVLPDLTKEQELKWFSNNNESIMPECAHNTNAGFDLRYSGTEAIKLEPHMRTCIDLKIVLKIPATTMVQLAFRNSLTKRGINIRGGIIDMRYVENIIAMLQNDSEKTYIIEPNKKIAQAIFLPLGFGSMSRINVPVNMAEEEIVGQREIISTGQAISIPPYNQYMLAIERKKKDQAQIFKAEASLCELGEVGLINLHIPAKDYSHIKISIYNNTGNVIKIPAETIIGYLNTEMKDQPPNLIPDFP
ncbi:hypothetical protein G9A89_019472 [Geosiphon pyriformis]|nr:hypothetical protein G9A89_019472 [Geosiphon pyriformis]